MALSAGETLRVEYGSAAARAYIRLTMTPKSDDLTWQADYAREYAPTIALPLLGSFGAAPTAFGDV